MRRVYYLALMAFVVFVTFAMSAYAQPTTRRAVPNSLSSGYFVVDSDDNSPAPWRPIYNFIDTSYLPITWNRVWSGPQQGARPGTYFFDPTKTLPSQMDTLQNCVAGPIFMNLSHHWNYYSGTYDSVYISSDGFIGFMPYSYATTGSPPNYCNPNRVNLKTNYASAPHSIIAAMWTELDLRHGGPADTSKVYYRLSTTADTFMVNYYNMCLHPASPNSISPFSWTAPGANELFCKKFQIILSNADSSIQINYGGFSGGVNGFPSLLAYTAFENNAAIGLADPTGAQGTGVLYGPLAPSNWLLTNNLCRSTACDPWQQTKDWAIKFKRWHDVVAAVSIDFPTRNYEICLGSSVTPQAKFQNVDVVSHSFKVRFSIKNSITGTVVYSRSVNILNLAAGATKDTTFAAYATNPNIVTELGTFNACAIATTFDTSNNNIGDQWPFDDTVCTSVFGVERVAVPFFDPSDNYSKAQTADIPNQQLWVSIGATVVDGESATWDPPPPRHLSAPVGPDDMYSPVIELDAQDVTGAPYAGEGPYGDTLVSFPINLQGQTQANLSFDFQRAGKFGDYYDFPWDATSMYGPEWTILNAQTGAVIRPGDSLLLEFKDPSQPGCNPAPTSWHPIAAIDGGQDFEFKKFFMSLNSKGQSTINIDGAPSIAPNILNYFTTDFRFRLRLKAKYDAGTPPPTDDNDPWYVDNPTVIIPLKPEIEVMWVRVADSYTKIPASEAISLPVYVKLANLSRNVEIAFPIRVEIQDQNQNTVYWQAVVVNSLNQGTDTVIKMPNWNAQDASDVGGPLQFQVNAYLDQSNISTPTSILGTYTQFYLNIDNPQQSQGVQEFAYDDAGLDPTTGNDWPGLYPLDGDGVGFGPVNGYPGGSGSFAMRFVVSTQDTFYGIRTLFGSINQSPDAIRLSLLQGTPGDCVPLDTVQQEGVQATMEATRGPDFDQWSTYYFPKPIVLTSNGSTRGVYWASVSQLSSVSNMALGTDRNRGGALVREWDYSLLAPDIVTPYNDPYGTQFTNSVSDGDISCAWAIETTAGSGGWSPWTPPQGWWPTMDQYTPDALYESVSYQMPGGVGTAGSAGTSFYYAGSYTPLIRAMVSEQGMLPVQFVYFKGDTSNGSAVLTWSTASEQNNAGFTIERKPINSDDVFEKIGYVASTSQTTTSQTGYGYIDKNVQPGTYDYQLIQTDLNGSQHLSNVVQLTIGAPSDFSVVNYPNPFTAMSGSTMFNYTVSVSAPVSLVIYNQLGQVVTTLVNGSVDQGSHSVRWDGTNTAGMPVAAGSYIATLISGEKSTSVNVTVTK